MNRDVLSEVTVRVDNSVLENLYKTELYTSISILAKNQSWWYKRVCWLTGRDLTWHSGNWAEVYASLDKNGLEFTDQQNYNSTILVRVLLELGADHSEHTLRIFDSKNRDAIRLLLEYPLSYDDYLLEAIIKTEDTDLIRLFVSKYPDIEDASSALSSSIRLGDIQTVKFFLGLGVTLDGLELDSALVDCIRYNYINLIEFLVNLEDVEYMVNFNDLLQQAVELDRPEILKIIVPYFKIDLMSPINEEYLILGWQYAFNFACKFRSLEIIELLMIVELDPMFGGGNALWLARKYDRQDVIELLEKR